MPHEISGNLAGSARLSLRNAATNANALLVLSGDNSGYTGTATLDSPGGRGIIRMTSNTAGSAAANWVINTSNTLQVAGNTSVQLGTLGGTGDIANPTAGTASTVNVGAGEFGGSFQPGTGAVALNKIGPGTLVLSGINSQTGGTTSTAEYSVSQISSPSATLAAPDRHTGEPATQAKKRSPNLAAMGTIPRNPGSTINAGIPIQFPSNRKAVRHSQGTVNT